MAALKEDRSYGLSCGRVSDGSKVSVFHVKLTDSALRAFENYRASQDSVSLRPSIRFQGSQGHISIPQPDYPSEARTFSFYLSNIGRDSPQGSFDCIQQYVSSHGDIHLDCLGSIQDKITVCATDDSYQKARQSMAQAEEETRSRGAIVIKPGGRYLGKKVQFRKPAPGATDTVPSRKRATPINLASAIKKSGVSGGGGISQRPFRDRVLHLLALRPYRKAELLLRLQKDGLAQADKDTLDSLLQQVANVNAKDGTCTLKDCVYKDVQKDWPGYSEGDQQLLKRMLVRKLCQPQSAGGLSGDPAATSPPREHGSSVSPPQKRPQPPDFIDPLANKKPRISHFTQRAQPAANGKLNVPHGREALLPTLGPLAGTDVHLPPRLDPPRAHDPLADVSNDLGHSGRDCDHGEVATLAPAACVSLPLLKDCAQPSRPHGGSSRGKSKKKSKKHKDKERAAGDRHRDRPPDLVPGSLGAPPVTAGLNGTCNSSSVPMSTSETPDYLLRYATISSSEQRQSYKNDFNAEYSEYRDLHARIEQITRRFTQLDAQLRQLSQGSEEYETTRGQILQEYRKIKKTNTNYSQEKHRYWHSGASRFPSEEGDAEAHWSPTGPGQQQGWPSLFHVPAQAERGRGQRAGPRLFSKEFAKSSPAASASGALSCLNRLHTGPLGLACSVPADFLPTLCPQLAAMEAAAQFVVESPNVVYSPEAIEAQYEYRTTSVSRGDSVLKVYPLSTSFTFRTARRVPRLGVMLVGWGGNNGSTLTAAVLANRLHLSWPTRTGRKEANYYGSLMQAGTVSLGLDAEGQEVFVPFRTLLPMVSPDDLVFDGWDISSLNLAEAMRRAQVLDWGLQEQLWPHMEALHPRPSVYIPEFIAANQSARADNLIPGTRAQQLEQIRKDIRDFRSCAGLDKVIVLWTANTERFCELVPGLNDTAENLLRTIQLGLEVSPSTLFAVASILEGCAFLNGSPQNTLVPGAVELARQQRVFVGGDDFKSGQTKVKSVLVDFLISSGLKTMSIVSYNHLGNNDGQNLSAPPQFRSKEVSKSSVVDDMVQSNPVLYAPGEKPDHCVVIKYVPYVGDSKRAMDEYTSELMLGGTNTLVLHNTCEDSLLAAPIMLDLVLLTELCQRVSFSTDSDPEPQGFHPVLSLLGFLFKAPLAPPGSPVVNSLFRQRSCIENIFRACVGLPPQNHMLLEHKMERPSLKQTGHVAAACHVSYKKELAPAAPNSCIGDTNGHSQAVAPLMPTT